jgi:hypothetical protein
MCIFHMQVDIDRYRMKLAAILLDSNLNELKERGSPII